MEEKETQKDAEEPFYPLFGLSGFDSRIKLLASLCVVGEALFTNVP